MEKIMGEGWRFHYSGYADETYMPSYWEKGFDDTDWEQVSVPHDWAVTMPFSQKNSSGTGYLAGGIGWYRLRFQVPKEKKGKKVQLVFEGVYKRSQVWCNGYYLGKWENGYTEFAYDITEQVNWEEDNVVAVKVTHTDIADSRWFTGSGINRPVSLKIQEKVHFVHRGVFAECTKLEDIERTTNGVTAKKAILHIKSEIAAEEKNEARLLYVMTDLQGKEIARNEMMIVTKEGVLEQTMELEIPAPKLWDVEQPYLYRLTGMIQVGELEDKTVIDIGLREFVFDSNKGFSLNGQTMKLNGVCLHEDAGCLGSVIPKQVWERRLEYLKKMGCNAIRMSHNPHAQVLYDLCDEMGFLVMDEVFDEWEGAKNKWSIGHNVYPPKHEGYYEDFPQCHEKDVHSFIRKTRNHPSIILWSIGNEIDYPNDPYGHPMFTTMTGNNDANKPAEERMYNSNRPNMERLSVLARHLTELVKKEDTSRPVTLAAAFPELSTYLGFIDAIDVVGYNYKEQYYEKDHVRFPGKAFLGSENGHSYEAYQAVVNNDYISGQFLWTGIDYLGEAHGWPVHGSGAGVMTLAGFPKSTYYFRQSLWSKNPMVHLVTARADEPKELYQFEENWNYFDNEEVTVHIYTNEEWVELFLNGRSLGRKTKNKEKGYITCQIAFEAGNLCARTEHASCELVTNGAACGLIASIYQSLHCSESEKKLYQIELQAVDRRGLPVYTEQTMLYVQVQGEGKLLGLENGDLADNTEYTANYRRMYKGKMIVYAETPAMTKSNLLIRGEGLQNLKVELF